MYRDVEILITEKEYRSFSRQEVKKTVRIVAGIKTDYRRYMPFLLFNRELLSTINMLFFTTSYEFNDLIIARIQSCNPALLERGYVSCFCYFA